MSVLVAQEPAELSCLLIPLAQGTQLLLPGVCIAEVLPWRRIKPLADAPEWCLGVLGWRGEVVPTIRFELLHREKTDVSAAGRCLVVMNRTQSSAGMPFYALAAAGLPRMVQLTGDDLGAGEGPSGRAVAQVVRVGTETAWIPDLGFLESQVRRLVGA
jgi:chemotaxis signal transduction protein